MNRKKTKLIYQDDQELKCVCNLFLGKIESRIIYLFCKKCKHFRYIDELITAEQELKCICKVFLGKIKAGIIHLFCRRCKRLKNIEELIYRQKLKG